MTENNITPPPGLLKQWEEQWAYEHEPTDVVLRRVFQAGADQELEACCEWLAERSPGAALAATELRAARRPNPPSLKEQAIAELDDAVMRGDCITVSEALPTIRRALEQLDD
jgi:hypothetical protein